jgi:hypothetical protein
MRTSRYSLLGVTTLALAIAAGCAGGGGGSAPGALPQPPDAQQPPAPGEGINADTVVVKSLYMMHVKSSSAGILETMSNPTDVPVTVINAPDANMEVDRTKFVLPPIKSEPLTFGQLIVSSLRDNNLKVSGTNGKTKCTKAYIRIYTKGTAGAGMWNAADGYGAPITAALGMNAAQSVGLNQAGAAVVLQANVAANKNVFRLSDFGVAADFRIDSDFSNAGAGTYSTTLVVEYGLSL